MGALPVWELDCLAGVAERGVETQAMNSLRHAVLQGFSRRGTLTDEVARTHDENRNLRGLCNLGSIRIIISFHQIVIAA